MIQAPNLEELPHDTAANGAAPSANPLAAYIRSIAQMPILKAERVNELVRQMHLQHHNATSSTLAEDWDRWQAVKNEIVVHHLRLVVSCALRFRNSSVPLLDLIQEGNIGLMDAIDRFDPDRGVRLSTYAFWWIRRHMLGAIENTGRTVRLPRHVTALQARVRKLELEWTRRGAELPGEEEIALVLECTTDAAARQNLNRPGALSLDQAIDATGIPLIDRIDDENAVRPDCRVACNWVERALTRGFLEIDERARRILTLRWGLFGSRSLTLSETGRCLGISGERVRQIETAAMARLRHCSELRTLTHEFD